MPCLDTASSGVQVGCYPARGGITKSASGGAGVGGSSLYTLLNVCPLFYDFATIRQK